MDDEGEVRDMNLSSRPKREERRRQRERDRLEREMDRDHRADGGQASSLEWSSVGWDGGEKPCVLQPYPCPSTSWFWSSQPGRAYLCSRVLHGQPRKWQ